MRASLVWELCLQLVLCQILLLSAMTEMKAQEHFDNFFEEVFTELEDTVIVSVIIIFYNFVKLLQ